MGRNRKNGSAVRFVPAMKAAIICALLGIAAIGYVYQKNQIMELGSRIQKREAELASVRDGNAKMHKQLLTMNAAKYLEQRVRDLGLGLGQPTRAQIMTIIEVPAGTPPQSQPLMIERANEIARMPAL
jgi:hypothetical protein